MRALLKPALLAVTQRPPERRVVSRLRRRLSSVLSLSLSRCVLVSERAPERARGSQVRDRKASASAVTSSSAANDSTTGGSWCCSWAVLWAFCSQLTGRPRGGILSSPSPRRARASSARATPPRSRRKPAIKFSGRCAALPRRSARGGQLRSSRSDEQAASASSTRQPARKSCISCSCSTLQRAASSLRTHCPASYRSSKCRHSAAKVSSTSQRAAYALPRS